MIANFFFMFYIAILGCAIPISSSFKMQHERSKVRWADSIYFLVSIQAEFYCFDNDNCSQTSEKIGTGTSFVIYNNYKGKYSILMTAAHLCDAPKEYYESISEEHREKLEYHFSLKVVTDSIKKEMYSAQVLRYNQEHDTCLIKINHVFDTQLKIADGMPDYGERVWTIGAPAGYFPESAKPIDSGYFMGEVQRVEFNDDGEPEYMPFYNFSLPTTQGMSGSPIINTDGSVVGMVSAVNVEWHIINYSPTIDQIREIIYTPKSNSE